MLDKFALRAINALDRLNENLKDVSGSIDDLSTEVARIGLNHARRLKSLEMTVESLMR